MIRYLHNIEEPQRPIVDANPRDIDRLRPALRSFLRRRFSSLGADEIEDVVQHVMIVACRSVPRGAVHGRYSSPPEQALRVWLLGAAWRSGMNAKRRLRNFVSVIEVRAEYDDVDPRSLPDSVVDARRMLELIAREKHGRGLRGLLLLVCGWKYREAALEMGITPATLLYHVRKLRKRLAALRERRRWRVPARSAQRLLGGRKRRR